MLATLAVLGIGGVLAFLIYAWLTGNNPSVFLGSVTSVVGSGSTYVFAYYTRFLDVIRACISGGLGAAGYAFVLVWFVAIPGLWFMQGMRGWSQNKPFLQSMIQ